MDTSCSKNKIAIIKLKAIFQYNLEKPSNEDLEEEDDDEDFAAARKVEEPEEDPLEGK